MAKKLKKPITASTVASHQEDRLWTLVQQLGNPVDYNTYAEGWVETAHSVGVPERLVVFARVARTSILAEMPRRQQHRFVLLIILKGAAQVCLDERIFRLEVGQALLIFPFQFRHFISVQESSIRWIFIGFEMPHADSLESRRNHPWQITPESVQILRQLLEAVSSRQESRMTRAAEAQLWLALFLNKSSAQGIKSPSSFPIKSTEAHKLLEKINDFIYLHMDQPFKLKEMARGVGCSESYLSHQFKNHFKISLGRYVAQVRLGKAVGLLRKNSLNISGVAQACGYRSLYAFGRKFRADMGCSPRDYRIQLNKRNTGRQL